MKRSNLILLYKIAHGYLNINLESINLAINYGITRSNELRFILPTPRTNILRNSFSFSTAYLWNSLPINIVSAPSLAIFRARLSCYAFDDDL